MEAKTIHYTTEGSVRGTCGHSHRTLRGAILCVMADMEGCASVGGYSDREVIREDGEPIDPYEYADVLDRIMDR